MFTTVKIILNDGDQTLAFELPSQSLAYVVARLPDSAEAICVSDLLVKHHDFEVRLAVAGLENLSTAAIETLAVDSSLSVVKQLLKSKAARPKLTSQQVLAISRRDPELAGFVAAVVEDFALVDDEVLSYLEGHPDTHVRAKLAGNPFAGSGVLRRLAASDADAKVREIAAEMLT